MSVLLIMIPAALFLAGIGIVAFILAVKSGQFDDLDTPALRAVFDDDDTITAQPTVSEADQSSHQDSKDDQRSE
ncbi:MAG: cbb3-type cytochrome oxidase assembly protein CcoS [Phycisphaerales bacterium]|nr:cbb3-type cytochrome oxidase assembly protein CcoS [Phycisphaerales bacterium]